MDFCVLDSQVAEFMDQVIQMYEGLDFLIVIDQEKASPCVFLEEHDPLLGVGRIRDHMGVKGNTFGMLGFHITTIHLGHHPIYMRARTLLLTPSLRTLVLDLHSLLLD